MTVWIEICLLSWAVLTHLTSSPFLAMKLVLLIYLFCCLYGRVNTSNLVMFDCFVRCYITNPSIHACVVCDQYLSLAFLIDCCFTFHTMQKYLLNATNDINIRRAVIGKLTSSKLVLLLSIVNLSDWRHSNL